MTLHDAFNEELLSAYLDGELSSEERQQVERQLATSDEHRALLKELQALVEDLERLPKYSLDGEFSGRVIERTKHLAQSQETGGDAAEFQPELLSAFVDGELTTAEWQAVQERLESDVESQDLVRQFRGLDNDLRSLSEYHLDDAFAERVLHRAEQALAEDEAESVAESVTVATRPSDAVSGASLRGFVWAAVTVAAALLLAFVFRGESELVPSDVAAVPLVPDDVPVVKDDLPETDISPATDIAVDTPDVEAPDDTELEQPDGPSSGGAWQLVVDMKQQANQDLLMVYELTVTSGGIQNAAFASLLQRHRIRFRDTLAVSEDEQRQLLKQLFLEDAKIVPKKTKGMDEIQLYLVRCKGKQADAIYQDLVGRPRGIGSFSLNLTTKQAGQGVLNRMCEASHMNERSNEAVELLGSFAILSQAARNLGAFGTIRWIEPSLLTPPQRDADETDAQDDNAAVKKKALKGDFACEILFVVRNLQPIDKLEENEK